MSKYGAVSGSCTKGHSHRSQLEIAVCNELCLREKAHEIRLDQIEIVVYLSRARIKYVCDFQITNLKTGYTEFVEAKGFETERWPTIKKLWKFYGPGPLNIFKGTWRRPFLDEVIIPNRGTDDCHDERAAG